ncbi:hypothetical protein [Fluviicola sp.]|jgi:hypothetical protein|uniref:hypothetical protein n=1 Tax=Fluviicola sp. TaxID=1917219 RepID=UPI00282E5A27|nr:hypothetical protein [Fluviicola sp.]MDR0801829.1 hypothetical protein [Fluviicola sp.]
MKYLYFFVLLTFGLSGCVKNNALPVWFEINNWTLNANPNPSSNPGVLTHNFTDVWVYIDGKIIGVFELPCKIPVLVSGSCKVTLYPAIRNNGISATKKIYPFMKAYENNMELVAGETYTINPTTMYEAATEFWVEDFEGSAIKIEEDQSVSNATLNRETNGAIGPWGSYGHIALNSSDSLWVGLSTDVLYLPKSGAEVYLEVNYRNTNSILTGLLSYIGGSATDNPNISMNAQTITPTVWKKIYIDLKDIVSNTPNSIYYRPYFRVLLDSGLSSSDVYIDNIKVVHF